MQVSEVDAAAERALGSDPFDAEVDRDPFLEGLEALGLEPASSVARPGDRLRGPAGLDRRFGADRSSGRLAPHAPDHWASTPALEEVEMPEPTGWLESWIPPQVRRRVAALAHLAEGESPYDRYGFSPEVARRSFPVLYALYKLYFRVQSEGHEHLPARGPAILVGNHAGLLPFDAAMVVTDCVLQTDPPRLPRSVVDLWAGSLPWINVFYARGGQISGTRENFADLLAEGQLLLVFPEGAAGVSKTIGQRYHLQPFRVGFIEQALAASAPIVPTAVIGSENQTPIFYDAKSLAKLIGAPAFPFTPTFPWLGPLGLLPYPVSYRIIYGEPLRLHERHDPSEAEDPELVRALATEVRQVVQELIDRHR